MNVVKLVCYQLRHFKNGNIKKIGFEIEDQTDIDITDKQIKVWTLLQIRKWYLLKQLQGSEVINLKQPFDIKAYLNHKLHLHLTLKKVPANTKNPNHIQLQKTNFVVESVAKSNDSLNEISPNFYDVGRIINAIDTLGKSDTKIWSSIIYTGMQN